MQTMSGPGHLRAARLSAAAGADCKDLENLIIIAVTAAAWNETSTSTTLRYCCMRAGELIASDGAY